MRVYNILFSVHLPYKAVSSMRPFHEDCLFAVLFTPTQP